MGLIDADDERAARAAPALYARVARKPRRLSSDIEAEIGQLYLGTLEEPVPHRLLTILRAGVCGSKA